MEQRIKEWYCKEYPTDELGNELNASATFQDLFDCLDHYQDVYNLMEVGDSLIRERLFFRLAELMEVGYDYIYDQWMRAV